MFDLLPCFRFSDKTRNDWEDRENFSKVEGKYDLLHMDYEANVTVSFQILYNFCYGNSLYSRLPPSQGIQGKSGNFVFNH